MQKRNKRILAAALAAAGVLAISGVAYAVYSSDKESNAIAGTSNAIQTLTVAGTSADGSLWPNQATNVTLDISNPNDTAMLVKKVAPVGLQDGDITGINNDYRTYCRNQLQLTGAPTLSTPIGAGDAGGPGVGQVVLANAIKLKEDTDNRCQGMTFSTKWTVTVDTAYAG